MYEEFAWGCDPRDDKQNILNTGVWNVLCKLYFVLFKKIVIYNRDKNNNIMKKNRIFSINQS